MVFGRRKTGKTYFVRNMTDWEEYFTVSPEGVIYTSSMEELDYPVFLERLKGLKDKPLVIDEFHRLPRKFLTLLQHLSPPWTLVTSTLHLARDLLSSHSPIMGLFYPLQFDLISPLDILRELSPFFRGPELVENAVYLREPLLLPFDSALPLRERLRLALPLAESLIGEIFREEERRYTISYASILKAASGGYVKMQKLGRFLDANPSFYVDILRQLGLLRAVKNYPHKRKLYRHRSPLTDLYFYLSLKYLYDETGVFKEEALNHLLPIHIEWFVEELLSEVMNLEPMKILNPEIDVALGSSRRPEIVVEVKWGDMDPSDVRKVEKKLEMFRARRILLVRDPTEIDSSTLEVWGPENLLSLASTHKYC